MPFLHGYTAKFLPRFFPVKGLPSLLVKLAFDQTVGASVVISIFFLGMSVFEGKGLAAGITNWKERFWVALKGNWVLWPMANLLNYGLVPIKFQVLFSNVVALVWNSYLSYMQNTYKKK